MSNEYQEDSELFEAEQSDDSSEENSDDESTTLSIDKDKQGEEIKTDKKSVEQAKQIDAFTKKVLSGELDLENLPERQQWVKPYIEERLATLETAKDLDAVVEEKLEAKLKAKDDADLFNRKRDELSKLKLTAQEKAEIEAEYKDFKSVFPPGVALEKAMKVVGLKADDDVAALRQAMALPKSGHIQRQEPEVNPTQLKSIDQRIEMYEQLRGGK